MTRFISILAMFFTLFATGAMAQQVGECDYRASGQAIAEPWEANTRTFANGNVRLTLTDTIEPAAGAFHVMVLSPPYDEVGGRQCRVISANGGIGFGGMEFGAIFAEYDPARGLFFEIPVTVFDDQTGGMVPQWLNFTLNQATGQIDAWMHSGA